MQWSRDQTPLPQVTSCQVLKGEGHNQHLSPTKSGCLSHSCLSEQRRAPELGMLSVMCADTNLQGTDEEVSEGLHGAEYVL